MALVAYSDESDPSDNEEEQPLPNGAKLKNLPSDDSIAKLSLEDQPRVQSGEDSSTSNGCDDSTVNGHEEILESIHGSGIDSIVDEDDDDFSSSSSNQRNSSTFVSVINIKSPSKNGVLLDDFAFPHPVQSPNSFSVLPKSSKNEKNVPELAEDKLSDVPTKETWDKTKKIIDKEGGELPTFSKMKQTTTTELDDGCRLGAVALLALSSNPAWAGLTRKKSGNTVKLLMPSLDELPSIEDEEDSKQDAGMLPVKIKPSRVGTGLLSRLPEVKNLPKGKESNRVLEPYSLSNRAKNKNAKLPSNPKMNAKTAKMKANKSMDEEDSDDEDVPSADFFSLDTEPEIFPEIPIDINVPIINQVSRSITSSESDNEPIVTLATEIDTSGASYVDDESIDDQFGHDDDDESIVSEAPSEYDLLDDESWRRLTGRKRKAEEEIDLIDVNPNDALMSKEELVRRTLTTQKPTMSHSKKNANLPSQQQRKKHQITYLAHQAKEREAELESEWSAGKQKKMQTRAKYGF